MTPFGTSGLTVFPLVLGGNTFGWTSDAAESRAVLDAFVAQGGNFIDTADSYTAWIDGNSGGESETIIGSWLAQRSRNSILIGTKVSQHPDFRGLAAANVKAAAEASLTRLGTDYIDVYFAHYDDVSVPLEETAAAFDALVTAGKIRAVALSNYSADRIQEWFTIAQTNGFATPVALQPHYNLLHRTDVEGELAPIIAEHKLAVLPYFGLAAGFLTGKYRSVDDIGDTDRSRYLNRYASAQAFSIVDALEEIAQAHATAIAAVALAWLRSRTGVLAPLASARTVEQLSEVMASTHLELMPDEIATLDAVSEPRSA
ncbi:MAG TPA: aldo/keto reductase [Pseudolysinimonas sp.]|nr:aldo/keto reductase [Pseudolysinimonas sp.]